MNPHNAPLYDTTPLTAALANPYAQHYASSHMSPHYYQAYLQAYSNGPPRTTADGYTLSSTYNPGTTNQTSRKPNTIPPPRQPSAQITGKPISNHLTYGSWYQPGNVRCTRQGCPFTGSRKSVEIHMMDRHLIFPPGWEKKDDWDADPSLKGKPIAIHGTSLLLDTPEAIDAWIAERKRRFPTEAHVRDKKRKFEEAVARGQLTPEDMRIRARKKHRGDTRTGEGAQVQRSRGDRRGDLSQRRGSRAGDVDESTSGRTGTKSDCAREESPDSGTTSADDGAPEVVSSKAPITPTSLCMQKDVEPNNEVRNSRAYPQESARRIPQPKKPLRNPFASRSTLLRNLLLPEIRVTVSNLSQAIHFLVENDFLRGVELRPGEALEQMIEVLDSHETAHSTTPPPRAPSIEI